MIQIRILLATVLVLGLAACGKKEPGSADEDRVELKRRTLTLKKYSVDLPTPVGWKERKRMRVQPAVSFHRAMARFEVTETCAGICEKGRWEKNVQDAVKMHLDNWREIGKKTGTRMEVEENKRLAPGKHILTMRFTPAKPSAFNPKRIQLILWRWNKDWENVIRCDAQTEFDQRKTFARLRQACIDLKVKKAGK